MVVAGLWQQQAPAAPSPVRSPAARAWALVRSLLLPDDMPACLFELVLWDEIETVVGVSINQTRRVSYVWCAIAQVAG